MRHSRTGAARLVSAVAVAAGTFLRVEQYATRRSLWLDEAMLALNIVHRGFRGLARPLAYEQGAPVGWLWVQRVLVDVFGRSELVLRVVPLLAGVGAVIVIAILAARTLGGWPAAVATTVVALSPAAIRYSAEVKQYSSDLFVMSVVVWLAVRASRSRSPRDVVPWAVAAALAPWLSHAALVVVPAAAIGLLVAAVDARDMRRARSVVVASAACVASVGVLYAVSLRGLRGNRYLRDYWSAALAPRPLSPGSLVRWFGRVLPALARNPGHLGLPWLALALAAGGLAVLTLHAPTRVLGVVLAAMIAGAILAAVADSYPLSGRLALYLVVPLAFGLAGAVGAGAIGGLSRRAVAWIAVVVVVAPAVVAALGYGVHPFHTPDTRDVLAHLARRPEGARETWVQWPEVPVASFYATGTVGSLARPVAFIGDGSGSGSGGCAGVAPEVAARGARVWAVFGYRLSTAPVNERALMVDALATRAALVERFVRGGAAAYLFDFGRPPAPGAAPTGAGASSNGLQCVTVNPMPALER